MNTPGSPGAFISSLGERGLIARIRQRLPAASPHLHVGVGDDAAVAVPERGTLQVLTTDALVEGVHFDWRLSTPADVGYKALAVNLSDIAAMGATPRLALLSLVLPDHWTLPQFDGLIDGFLELAGAERVALAGGNISRSPGPVVVDVTVMGSARPRKVLTRAGGRPGDGLFVTGAVGGAAAGLGWIRAHGHDVPNAQPHGVVDCVSRYRRPVARTRIGSILGRTGAAAACIDVSDGLAEAVHQLAEASGTGARVDARSIPVLPGARAWFEQQGLDPVLSGIGESEDYELLFAVHPRRGGRLRGVSRLSRGVALTRIGELTSGGTVVLLKDGALTQMPRGFSHF